MTTLKREFQVSISHPFCLPNSNAPVPRQERLSKMKALQKGLGDDWEIFDIDGILPATIRKRKKVLLTHRPTHNQVMLDCVEKFNAPYKKSREVVSVQHSAYFWDFGLCAVDVLITFRLLDASGMINLYTVVESFEEEMLAGDLYKPPGMETWAQVEHVFSRGFDFADMKQVHWLTSSDAETLLLETCCWNVLAIVDSDNGLFVSKEVLESSFEEFCGTNISDTTFDVGVTEYFATHTGYSGNMAIIYDEVNAIRVQWLWKVVAILYAALMESAEPCYDLVTNLVESGQGTGARSLAAITREIRLVQKIIDLLHAEANPVTICSESFDAEIYEKVFTCWGGREIEEMIDNRTTFLMNTLQDLSQQNSERLQTRLNYVVFVLTIVSVASTVAAIIALQDPGNELPAETRAIFLGVLTGIIGLMCLAVIVLEAPKWKCCRSRDLEKPQKKKVQDNLEIEVQDGQQS